MHFLPSGHHNGPVGVAGPGQGFGFGEQVGPRCGNAAPPQHPVTTRGCGHGCVPNGSRIPAASFSTERGGMPERGRAGTAQVPPHHHDDGPSAKAGRGGPPKRNIHNDMKWGIFFLTGEKGGANG